MTIASSTLGAPWGAVTVETTSEGLVVIRPAGAEPTPAHLGAAMDLSGATLVVDVSAGSVPPTAYVFDAFWAQTWLADAFGLAVANQVSLLAIDGGEATTLDAGIGYLSDTLVRLGVATWLHRWWPSGNPRFAFDFSVEILELEIGALRWMAEAAFVEPSPIERAVRPHMETLRSSYDWNRYRDDTAGQDVVEEVLITALRAVVDVVPEGETGYDECAELLNAIDTGVEHPAAVLRYAFEQMLDDYHALLVGGRAKGGERVPNPVPDDAWTELRSGWFTADVRDVPPRVLADLDNNVEWVVEQSGENARLSVTALAAPVLEAAPRGAPLQVRAFADGYPIVFDLAWTPGQDGALFVGSQALPGGFDAAAGQLAVGVFHPDWAGSARVNGAALATAERERREITDVLTDRQNSLSNVLAEMEVRSDPARRPTAAEIVARSRDVR